MRPIFSKKWRVLLLTAMCIAGLVACQKFMPSPAAGDSMLDGPVDGLTSAEKIQFLKGDVAFNDDVFTRETGLGPLFVATSCGSCHAGDGKGHPFTTLVRFGQSDTLNGNRFLHMGGPQLQQRALPGFQPEQVPAGAVHSGFTPPANTGLGFIDAIPDAAILALADPNDLDGDGISGRANWISPPHYTMPRPNSIAVNGKYIGRFGKKGATYDLLQQTANAYNQDMGITSSYEPYDTYSGQLFDPEVSAQTVLDVVFYLKTLKAPIQREQNNGEIVDGRQVFITIGCAKCHTPSFTTGASTIAALANKTISPYTDLLLHDMGNELNDGYTEGTAMPQEWRTPPLWGLGLSYKSQGDEYFLLHDGRAKNIEQAVLLHGGEGQKSKAGFQQLSAADKAKLIKFLESL
jgi:CxxC motif-containing protein (DUF1111 family)